MLHVAKRSDSRRLVQFEELFLLCRRAEPHFLSVVTGLMRRFLSDRRFLE